MKKAVIFCSTELDEVPKEIITNREDWLVVCADGGFRHAQKFAIAPDKIIGDGDSYGTDFPQELSWDRYPPEKDATDTQLCLDWAIGQGAKEVLLLGGIGGRLDHEFSHYHLMLYALKRGVRLVMKNRGNEIFMTDRSLTIQPNGKKYVSFFSFAGDVENFSVQGLKYEAEAITLGCDKVQASSNEFVGKTPGRVSFDKGYLLVMFCDEA